MHIVLGFFIVLLQQACGVKDTPTTTETHRALPTLDYIKQASEPAPESGFEQTLKAAGVNGNVSVANIEKYFVDPNNLNIRDKNTGNTPLLAAALYNNATVVKYLLAKGAVVDETYRYPDKKLLNGYSALLPAVMYQNLEMVQALLDANANPRIRPDGEIPAINWAVGISKLEILEKILGKDPGLANLATTPDGTLLHLASRQKNKAAESVKLLLRFGADKSLKNSRGQTAWDFALEEVKKAVPELKP